MTPVGIQSTWGKYSLYHRGVKRIISKINESKIIWAEKQCLPYLSKHTRVHTHTHTHTHIYIYIYIYIYIMKLLITSLFVLPVTLSIYIYNLSLCLSFHKSFLRRWLQLESKILGKNTIPSKIHSTLESKEL